MPVEIGGDELDRWQLGPRESGASGRSDQEIQRLLPLVGVARVVDTQRDSQILPVHQSIGQRCEWPLARRGEVVVGVGPQVGDEVGRRPPRLSPSERVVGPMEAAPRLDHGHGEVGYRRVERHHEVPRQLADGPLPAQARCLPLGLRQPLQHLGDPQPLSGDVVPDGHARSLRSSVISGRGSRGRARCRPR